MRSHEYSLLDGVNRSKVGRVIGGIAALISALVVFIFLSYFDMATRYGWPANIPPSLMSALGAGVVYFALYWFFNRFAWRWVAKPLRVPNLQGRWRCEGQGYPGGEGAQDMRPWEGEVKVFQSWDKLRIHLKTTQSHSDSVVAALMHDDTGGYRLIYNYENAPRNDQPELSPHMGFCDMRVAEDQQSAEGEYFNGRGRGSYGRMAWARKK